MHDLTGQARPTSIRVLRDGSISIVTVIGDHDLSSAPALHESLQREFAQRRACVVDLRGATLVDSAVLSVLLEARRQSREQGFELPLVVNGNRGSAVRRLVKSTMVTFPTFDDLDAAREAAQVRSTEAVLA
jgi:anti-anti-sigma factor